MYGDSRNIVVDFRPIKDGKSTNIDDLPQRISALVACLSRTISLSELVVQSAELGLAGGDAPAPHLAHPAERLHGLAVGADIQTRITERADKNYATQVFLSMTIGATRIEDEKVVEIECTES